MRVTLDTRSSMAFISGKFDPREVKDRHVMKKMRARMTKPKTKKRVLKDVCVDLPESVINRKLKRVVEPLPPGELINLTNLMPCIPITHTTMDIYIQQHKFPPPVKKVVRSRLWKIKEVQHWLDAQKIFKN